jgi:hypothetical protein
MRIRFRIAIAVLLGLLSQVQSLRAEDAFYSVLLKSLKLVDGKLPEPQKDDSTRYSRGELLEPIVQLDRAIDNAEVYLSYHGTPWNSWSWATNDRENTSIVVRAPAGQEITGKLYVPTADWTSLTPVRFVIPASAADPKAREGYYQTKVMHYEALAARGVPGSAWFRHQAAEAKRATGGVVNEPRPGPSARGNEIDDTYALFTGGRAVSENLQLDRVLVPRAGSKDLVVAVDSLRGITVKEFDWKPFIAGKTPALDPLALLIPADQHAAYFPSFEAATSLMDELDRQGTPILQQAEPRSEDADVKGRYQRQLCLPLTRIGRLLGPQLIASMAFTGSDPYLRVGSDVAVLFEPKNPGSLGDMLSTQMGINAGAAMIVSGTVGDESQSVAYKGYVTPDRRISAYIATIGETIIVTNSLVQLQRIADVRAGRNAAMATAPEYLFFRDRYRRGEANESGFIVMTDAAIRRWCSARWRIGDSRRTQAAAVMAEAQARHVNELALGKAAPAPLPDEGDLAVAGPLNLTASGVQSPVYGSLEFMTPIAELDLTKATQSEADTYVRWRDTYQQNWKNYFDPIAVRLSHTKNSLAADVTVMPLIAASEYGPFIEISQGAAVKPGGADPHGALVHMVMSINGKSERMKGYGALISQYVPQLKIEPFSWIGPTASLFVDDDPALDEAAKAEKPDKFFESHPNRVPVGLRIESTDGLKMALFLAAVHGFIDQSAPGLVKWETLNYKDQPYARITEAQRNQNAAPRDPFSICYTTVGGVLLITPSESLLKRSLDRQAAATQPSVPRPATQSTQPTLAPWLGENFCLQLDGAGVRKILTMGLLGNHSDLQRQSWDNLPILNEWKHRFPDLDPIDVHERLWQTHLIDPAGGTYTWNAALQTMESSAFGCPAAPKPGPAFPPVVQSLRQGNFGMTFENQGLRARVELQRAD